MISGLSVLQTVEQQMHALLDEAPLVLFAIDRAGIFTHSEGRGLRALGWRSGEMIGRSAFEHYRDSPWIIDALHRALEGEIVQASGEVAGLWYSAQYVPLWRRGVVVGVVGLALDVTERKRAEAALEERESHMRLVIEQLPAVLWTTDRELRITSSEGAALAHLGLRAGELVGVLLQDFMGGPEAPGVAAHHRALTGERVSFASEWRGRSYHTLIEPLLAADGEVIGTLGISFDMTEQKLAEEGRECTISILRATLESTADGLLVVDRDGRISAHNRKFAEMWGIPDEVLDGRDDAQMIHLALRQVKDPDAFLAGVRELYAHPEMQRSDDFELADGRIFERYSQPQRLGYAIVGRVWSFRDVTARRRAEVERDRLLAEEQRARTRAAFLAEASKVLAATLDYESSLAALARLAVPLLGDWCAIDEITDAGQVRRLAVAHADPTRGEVARGLAAWTPRLDDREGIGRVLHAGERRVGRDAPGLPPLGAVAPEHADLIRRAGVRAWLSVPLAARGRILGALTFVSAADPDRYGDAEISLVEDLAQRAALAVDNARLYREAQRAVQLRDEFLSIASHELYTPLTSLRLILQSLLASQDPACRTQALQRRLSMAERQGERLTTLVGSLLDVSRIEVGRFQLDLQEMDLAALVRDVVARFEQGLARANCLVSLDAELPVIGRWDRSRLEQVITNLLSNAMKYGASSSIEIAVTQADGAGRLTISDHGIGIQPDRLPYVFDRFERAVSSREYGGLGLGLYVCRWIVEQHGGTIRVESAPGQGATFTVELPCAGPST
uniref:histidine kinase n=1 Tax=Phaselicystis flava TaxID=525924 RepID=A0A3S5GYF5_9BACT|nr:sensory box histidine kinase [Phaselicystis flava]